MSEVYGDDVGCVYCTRCNEDITQQSRAVFNDGFGVIYLCEACTEAMLELERSLELDHVGIRYVIELERTFS